MSSFQEVDLPDTNENSVAPRDDGVYRTEPNEPVVTPNSGYDSSIPEASALPEYRDEDVDEHDVQSSYENIIPPQMVKGLGLFYSWASSTATVVQEKAKKISESETVKEFTQKTQEMASQAATVATPYWEQTVTTFSEAAESASEQATLAAIKMQPTFDKVSNSIAESAASGWQSFSSVASKWMDVEEESNPETHVETHIGRDGSDSYESSGVSKGPMVL